MQTEILKLQAMSGENRTDVITRTLEAINGVSDVRMALEDNRATIQFDERLVTSEQLRAALAGAGYSVDATQPAAKKSGGCCGGCGGQE
jgi:copper chaperone CopZ